MDESNDEYVPRTQKRRNDEVQGEESESSENTEDLEGSDATYNVESEEDSSSDEERELRPKRKRQATQGVQQRRKRDVNPGGVRSLPGNKTSHSSVRESMQFNSTPGIHNENMEYDGSSEEEREVRRRRVQQRSEQDVNPGGVRSLPENKTSHSSVRESMQSNSTPGIHNENMEYDGSSSEEREVRRRRVQQRSEQDVNPGGVRSLPGNNTSRDQYSISSASTASPTEPSRSRVSQSGEIEKGINRDQFVLMDCKAEPVSNDPASPASSASSAKTYRSHFRQTENSQDSPLSPLESRCSSPASSFEDDSPQPYQRIPRDVSPSVDLLDQIAEEPEVSLSLTLPKKLFSTFWKLVDVCERLVKDDAQKDKINQQILAYITSDPTFARGSVLWVFAVLGACRTFLSKSPEGDGEHSEQDLPQDTIKACAELVILIASFFHEANQCPVNLKHMFQHNGFSQVLAPLLKLLTMVHDLSSTTLKPIDFVSKKIGDELLIILTNRLKTIPQHANMLALDEAVVQSHIVENIEYFQSPTQLIRIEGQEERINTIIGWSRAVNLHHRRKIEEIMEQSERGVMAQEQAENDDGPTEQPELFKSTVNEIRGVRSKSAESLRQSGFNGPLRRCLSSMELSELTRHAEKKKEFVKQMVVSKKTVPGTIPLPLHDQDLLNPHCLFTGIRNATDVQMYQVIAGMLGYDGLDGKKSENSEIFFNCISEVFKNKGLLHLVGDSLLTKYGSSLPLGPKPTSMVVEKYRNFLQRRKRIVLAAREMMDTFRDLKLKPEYQQFKDLIDCYEKIFKFHIYLIEHYLDLAGKQIFNPYAIYQAEKTQNIDLINREIGNVEQQAQSIMMAYLNFSPLKRQLDDLSKISANYSKEKMDCHVAYLCRLAIFRIRVPQTAEKMINGYGWINSTTSHQDTYNLADLKIQESTPLCFDEKDYLQKVARREIDWRLVRKQATSYLASRGKIAPSVVSAALQQSQDFFNAVKVLMPSEAGDPKMKIFFQNQVIQVLLGVIFKTTHYPTAMDFQRIGSVHTSLLISAIVDRPCRTLPCTKLAEAIDAVFKKMSRFSVMPLPMCPSTMGVSFNCFAKRLMVSSVKESNREVQDQCVTTAEGCLNVDEQLRLSTGMGSKFNVIVDEVEGVLSLAWFHLDNNYKNDRIVVAKLPEELYKPTIRWVMIVEMYFKTKLNWLNDVLNEEPLCEHGIETPRLGRMEKPTSRSEPVREDSADSWFVY